MSKVLTPVSKRLTRNRVKRLQEENRFSCSPASSPCSSSGLATSTPTNTREVKTNRSHLDAVRTTFHLDDDDDEEEEDEENYEDYDIAYPCSQYTRKSEDQEDEIYWRDVSPTLRARLREKIKAAHPESPLEEKKKHRRRVRKSPPKDPVPPEEKEMNSRVIPVIDLDEANRHLDSLKEFLLKTNRPKPNIPSIQNPETKVTLEAAEEEEEDPFADSMDDSLLIKCSQAVENDINAKARRACPQHQKEIKVAGQPFENDSFDLILSQMPETEVACTTAVNTSGGKKFHSEGNPSLSNGAVTARNDRTISFPSIPPYSMKNQPPLPGGRVLQDGQIKTKCSKEQIERKKREAIRRRKLAELRRKGLRKD